MRSGPGYRCAYCTPIVITHNIDCAAHSLLVVKALPSQVCAKAMRFQGEHQMLAGLRPSQL